MISILAIIGKTIAGTALLIAFFWVWFKTQDWFEDHEAASAILLVMLIVAFVLGIGGVLGHGLYDWIFG